MQERPLNTFSMVAFDPNTGELGSASASCSLAVGGAIAYSRAGVGVVNTQQYAHLGLGEQALDLIEAGEDPQHALLKALRTDRKADLRQLIAIDSKNRKGAWTGARCTPAKFHRFGKDCAAAGNTLAGEQVIDKMIEVFERHRGEALSRRLLLAMDAGQAEGGDKRGKQSAALKIMPGSLDTPEGVNIDLRVDDHAEPLRELRRLYDLFLEQYHHD